MGLIQWMFGKKASMKPTYTSYKLINDIGDGFYAWQGSIYKSDIVRACIRPKAKAIGKLMGKHIRDNANGFVDSPDPNIKMLLIDPNPLMSGQMLQEKLAVQLELNNNAFALIKRDPSTLLPTEIYPIPALEVEMLEGPHGDMYLRFYFEDGSKMVAPYSDVIHLRQDFNKHNMFGDSPQDALIDLMDVVKTIDQGIIKAIKNSNIIKWLLKFNQTLRPEDITAETKRFVDDFLSSESKTTGAAATDAKAEAKQVEYKSFVPDEKQMGNTTERIYNFFNTNKAIVQSDYTEDQWNAYYESVIEPVAMQLANEYTRKLFSRRERGFGNKIVFESISLQYASMTTKLALERMVDRGAMTPNEWRKILNISPIAGGDKPIRRLDTAEVKDANTNAVEGGEDDEQNGDQGTTDGSD
ncbi:phage portal protein [Halalkalibacter sp. APA_J-10(15)]|uniref:phage portal protein n=1 Tax=Halalkalibacter sp. APA_J-10(15) TaxID=2933805 RepID=UPI001FF4A25F|nr:phage portal protein [Halalkalibacter sp. APA_J-10(15)]MCK0471401.1 phage portal protein [Halalkalibacter sp. APA_J-10(15)]